MEPPDRLEKGIRFGCGFVFGCVVTLGAVASFIDELALVASCLAVPALFGYLAMKYGDRFWERISRWLP